jgi:signal transduction histidine kinase
MRERVQAFGGELHTGAGEGGTGFRITAVLPLPGASTTGGGGGDG